MTFKPTPLRIINLILLGIIVSGCMGEPVAHQTKSTSAPKIKTDEQVYSAPKTKTDEQVYSGLGRVINTLANILVASFHGAETTGFKSGPIQDVELFVRVPFKHFLEIEKYGLLNQHVTGESQAILNAQKRLAAEMGFFFRKNRRDTPTIPKDINLLGELLPKYSMINYKTTEVIAQKMAFDSGQHYGDMFLVLKPGVNSRATYSIGDSLECYNALPQFQPQNGHPAPKRVEPCISPLSNLQDLLIFQKTGLNPWGSPIHVPKPPAPFAMPFVYLEAQIWGIITFHDVKEIWFSRHTAKSKAEDFDRNKPSHWSDLERITKKYALEAFEVADGPMDHQSYQAHKKLAIDHSATPITTSLDNYLDLDALEKAYSTATPWEKAHIESAFALTQNAQIPAYLRSFVDNIRQTKSKAALNLLLELPDSFMISQNRSKALIALLCMPIETPWISQSEADQLKVFMNSHPSVLQDIPSEIKLSSCLQGSSLVGVDLSGIPF